MFIVFTFIDLLSAHNVDQICQTRAQQIIDSCKEFKKMFKTLQILWGKDKPIKKRDRIRKVHEGGVIAVVEGVGNLISGGGGSGGGDQKDGDEQEGEGQEEGSMTSSAGNLDLSAVSLAIQQALRADTRIWKYVRLFLFFFF